MKDLEALLEAVKVRFLSSSGDCRETAQFTIISQEVEPSFAARTSLRSYCHKHDLQHLLPAATEEAAKPDPSTPQGKALNRILANKHLHEALTSIAPKLDPMNTTPATSNSNAPVAGPSKSKQLAASKDAKPIAKKSKLEPAAASTFLPSLSTGFTLGDSDAEDDFPLSDGEQPDPEASQRRNRRGQRARRA